MSSLGKIVDLPASFSRTCMFVVSFRRFVFLGRMCFFNCGTPCEFNYFTQHTKVGCWVKVGNTN